MMFLIPHLPPGYALWKFKTHKDFHDFAQLTGHGSNCSYLEKGVIAAVYEGSDVVRSPSQRGLDFLNEPAFWARHYGATRLRKQPKKSSTS